MRVTLIGHSGFLVELERICLVFDVFTDERGVLQRVPFGEKPVLFFASHAHHDHYNKIIYRHAGRGKVGYILGQGIPRPKREDAVVLDKGQTVELLGARVTAYGSTDTGVSFWVEAEGKRLFHAGDLNDWYWEDESTQEELKHDEQWFLEEIAPLAGLSPDVAFFPVDARLGRHALRGALHFARTVRPTVLVPMHLSGGLSLPGELKEALKQEGLTTSVAALVKPNDSIEL